MALSTPWWLIAMLIVAIGQLPGTHPLPCFPNRNCLAEVEENVADNVCFSPVTQFPTTATTAITAIPATTATTATTAQTQTSATPQGTYYTTLEKDVRPSIQPFPIDISVITVDRRPGLLHTNGPHLDSATPNVIESNSPCYYKGKACPGSLHSVESPVPSWSLPRNTSSTNAVSTTIGTSTSLKPPKHTGCDAPYQTDIPTSSLPEQTTALPSSSTSTESKSSTTLPSSSALNTSTKPYSPQMSGQNIFDPINYVRFPGNIQSRNDHFVSKEHVSVEQGPIQTNKFYANLFLGGQTNNAFTTPYAVSWGKGGGVARSWGLVISHTERTQLAFGPQHREIPGAPVQYYINPIGIQSMIMSAAELGSSTVLTVEKPEAFSADAVFRPVRNSGSKITFPLVQGMGFVTGVYTNLQLTIQSGVFFRTFTPGASPKAGVFKYSVLLEDNTKWLIYVIPTNGADPNLRLENNGLIRGRSGFSGTVQVAKNPSGPEGERVYDQSSGVYATSGSVSGSVNGATGTYGFSWEKAGNNPASTPLLMFALPHHIESFGSATRGALTNLHLQTRTKGRATAILANSWTLVEDNLPVNIGFAPWNPSTGRSATLTRSVRDRLRQVAPTELSQDIRAQTYLDSMYFSGKGLAKFAMLVYTVWELAQDRNLAEPAFNRLKDAFAAFANNTQRFPLVYDNVWKGLVSSGTYQTRDPGLDFGNTLYNDHHFHYGYFILAAAIIGTLDPSWLNDNSPWVNTLIRDAGNPVTIDPYFPFSRAFDWYSGHSWAKGLFESGDGKDQESTSEDNMFAYAIKMWGQTIGDRSMEARGNMMLAILRRSLNSYFLMKSDNVHQPRNFIDNKVTGILFENKADHATYFGSNLEFIQGIHMLPLIPSSPYIRLRDFVSEEWNAMFREGATRPASTVLGGWQGVLFSNLAIIDAQASWNFFNRDPFDLSRIDGGTSRTWSLAFAAGKF
ncbi:hypothetical protein ACJ72_07609 [Emergomyces africanus]|uniref:glucan endo-1,3-beta-D-glucosidase n=1 Tax=Emergomyces africanus TaxID=1955775 RepID=A0A1B7NN38_9EURO|nr:hypothetical protein ACJ72_07609 [Emergomyces africanus]